METLLALPEGGEWIVLLVVVVLLFGANRLPELTRNTARALIELKKVTRETEHAPTPQELTAEERRAPQSAAATDAEARQQTPPPTA
jgi:sec-independent protein translocase protein TatA